MKFAERLSRFRSLVRQGFPFGLMLAIGLALISLRGGSLTDNFIYLALLVPFGLALTAADARRLVTNPVLIAFAIYLIALWASLLGRDATFAQKQWFLNRMLVELAFTALIAWYVARSRPRGEVILALALGIILASDVLAGLWGLRSVIAPPGAPFVLPPWPNPNTGAAVCAATILFLVNAAAKSPRRGLRIGFGLLSLTLLVAILLSRSRGALITVALATITVPLVQRRWKALAAVLIGLAALSALAAIAGFVDFPSMLARGDASRFMLWQSFGQVALENFWRGIGIHREYSVVFTAAAGDRIDNPHNMFVATLLYGGIATLLAWVALLIVILNIACRAAFGRGDGFALSLCIFLFCYGLVESVMLASRPAWHWVVYVVPLGCIAGVWSAQDAARRQSQATTS